MAGVGMGNRNATQVGVMAMLLLGASCGDVRSPTELGTSGLTALTLPNNGTTNGDADSGADDDNDTKLDVSPGNDGGQNGGDCPGGGGMMGEDVEFSYIWVANSPQGTVSKIDTRTGVEVGRYATGPVAQESPSRTSVNLYGDVAVSNRGSLTGGQGGVTKIVARLEDCVDANANGMIETSTDATNVLPWGSDECVQWNLPLPSDGYDHGPRPTAWEGSVTQQGCASSNPRLWVGWYDYLGSRGVFHRLDGDTGDIEDTVEVAPWNGLNYGPYGGAVNKDGDLWVIGWQLGPLVRIDGTTLDVERIEMPPPPLPEQQWSYGMALDQYGNPWIASAGTAALYDVTSGQWQYISTGNQSMRGVMVDSEDRAWFAVDATATGDCGIGVIDVLTRSLLTPAIPLPGCFVPVGVSIDIDGYVWVIDQFSQAAYKVDPETYQVELSVTGLQAPYTYSDMTGRG